MHQPTSFCVTIRTFGGTSSTPSAHLSSTQTVLSHGKSFGKSSPDGQKAVSPSSGFFIRRFAQNGQAAPTSLGAPNYGSWQKSPFSSKPARRPSSTASSPLPAQSSPNLIGYLSGLGRKIKSSKSSLRSRRHRLKSKSRTM